jgi:hypothetical protein
MKLGIDVNRHKEIIVKAVSAILLLLLKHFKVKLPPVVTLILRPVLKTKTLFPDWQSLA